MYHTSSGGYYYQGPVKLNRKSNNSFLHMNINRAVKVILFISLIAASFIFGAMIQAYATNDQDDLVHPTSDRVESAYIMYSVESGDTLWSIAKAYLPGNTDIRVYIADIKEMNDLKSSMLREGQTLQVPIIR